MQLWIWTDIKSRRFPNLSFTFSLQAVLLISKEESNIEKLSFSFNIFKVILLKDQCVGFSGI